ncbi:MAG TPA: hypothetical protein VFO79_03240 [Xanthomonadales bacterium]|nr:hypothetical protein [Xanthomonadales bacterium]
MARCSGTTIRFAASASLFAVAAATHAGTIDELYADGFEDLPDCEALRGTPACPGFALVTAPIPAGAPGATRASCYFFRAPNTDPVAVRELESSFGTGVARIVLYVTVDGSGVPVERHPPGTILQDDCETAGTAGVNIRRLYQAHEPVQLLTMPFDDGGGDPVAIPLAAQQPLAMAVHRILPDAAPATTQVDLVARGLPRGRTFTATATYMATNIDISIPPQAVGHVVARSCPVPANVAFWWFSTHTHRQGTLARVQRTGSATTTIVESTDWESPAIASFATAPFFVFQPADQLRYECTYVNPSDRTITFGPDEDSDEQCVAITYFFPATRPLICVNSLGPI